MRRRNETDNYASESRYIMSVFTIDPDRYATIDLKGGKHKSPDEGMCLMEAVAYLVGETHSDHPQCVSPMLATFGRSLNDMLQGYQRQELISLIPSLPGTVDDGLDERRGFMALDWMARTWLPTWLDLVPSEYASTLRDMDRIVDITSVLQIAPLVSQLATKAVGVGNGIGVGNDDLEFYRRYAMSKSMGEAAAYAARSAGMALWPLVQSIWSAGWCAIRADVSMSVLDSTARELADVHAVDLYRDMIKDPG